MQILVSRAILAQKSPQTVRFGDDLVTKPQSASIARPSVRPELPPPGLPGRGEHGQLWPCQQVGDVAYAGGGRVRAGCVRALGLAIWVGRGHGRSRTGRPLHGIYGRKDAVGRDRNYTYINNFAASESW